MDVQQQKIVLIGDAAAGKTMLAHRMLGHNFDEKYVPTLGADVFTVLRNNINYSIWDTAGDEKYGGLKGAYWLGSDYVFIVIDGKNSSAHELQQTYERYKQEALSTCGDRPIITIVNKCDSEDIQMKFEEIQHINDILFISCKNGINAQYIFNVLE